MERASAKLVDEDIVHGLLWAFLDGRKRMDRVRNQLSNKSAARRGGASSSATASAFWTTLWPSLVELGWSTEHGSRKCDTFFMPPGVRRRIPMASTGIPPKCRIDFFDSVKQVMSHVQGGLDNFPESVGEAVKAMFAKIADVD